MVCLLREISKITIFRLLNVIRIMKERDILIRAIEQCGVLHEGIADAAIDAELKKSKFDKSYIDYLDTQIKLCPRGEDWNKRLKKRRESLVKYVGIELIDAHIILGNDDYWIKVDPDSEKVVHVEVYNDI